MNSSNSDSCSAVSSNSESDCGDKSEASHPEFSADSEEEARQKKKPSQQNDAFEGTPAFD